MKTVRSIFLAAALAATASSQAVELETLVAAVETAPSQIILPNVPSGMMTFRPCSEECDAEYVRVQLTPATKFSVNGRAVKFDEFRAQFANLKHGETSYSLVSYDTRTNTLVSLTISN